MQLISLKNKKTKPNFIDIFFLDLLENHIILIELIFIKINC